MKTERKIYCTTYCNKGHYEDTGRPVGHECRIIPPAAIAAEKADDFDTAIRLINAAPAVIVRGRTVR